MNGNKQIIDSVEAPILVNGEIPIVSVTVVEPSGGNVPLVTASFVPSSDTNNRVDLSKLNQRPFNERYLVDQGFSAGLVKTIKDNHEMVMKRYWVVDNSGSMLKDDSLRVLSNRNISNRRNLLQKSDSQSAFLRCTRWRELQQCVITHVEAAAHVGLNSTFRLLNKPGFGLVTDKFNVANDQESSPEDEVKLAAEVIMETEPYGASPLTKALKDIQVEIQSLSPYLFNNDKKIFIIIATDGLPTKNGKANTAATEEFMRVLRSLELYPVWIVIRLCSSDPETVAFYRGLDEQLERNVDVVSSFADEAKLVTSANSWLNYPFPVQFCRETGTHVRVFDILNERLLTKDEMVTMCKCLFGADAINALPDPHVDWEDYSNGLERLLEGTDAVWNHQSNRLQKWIIMSQLNKIYGPNNDVTINTTSTGCNCSIM